MGDRASALAEAVFYYNLAWADPSWAGLGHSFITTLILALWNAPPEPEPFLARLRRAICYSNRNIRFLLEQNQPDLESLSPEIASQYSNYLCWLAHDWELKPIRRAAVIATAWLDGVQDSRRLDDLEACFLNPQYTTRH
jgi:hypothetical protein